MDWFLILIIITAVLTLIAVIDALVYEEYKTGLLLFSAFLWMMLCGLEVYTHSLTRERLEVALDQVNELKIERDREIIRDIWK